MTARLSLDYLKHIGISAEADLELPTRIGLQFAAYPPANLNS